MSALRCTCPWTQVECEACQENAKPDPGPLVRPLWVIVNSMGLYYAGHRTIWSLHWNGEHEPCGRRHDWTPNHWDALVFEHRRSAERSLRRIQGQMPSLTRPIAAIVGP